MNLRPHDPQSCALAKLRHAPYLNILYEKADLNKLFLKYNIGGILKKLFGRLFVFRPMFPSAMQPPVLAGIFADELFDCAGIFGCNPFERIAFVFPFLREDNTVDNNFKPEAVINPSAAPYHYWYIISDSEQADALVSACFSAEEINENPLPAGVLVGYHAKRSTARDNFLHLFCSSFFIEYLLPYPLSDAVQIAADEFIVQWSGDAVYVEAEQSKDIADNLEIAVMGGDHQKSPALLHEPFDFFDIFIARIITPIIFFYKAGSEQYVHCKHCDMFEAALSCLVYPLFGFFGKACAEVFNSPVSASMIMFPQQSA